MKKKGFTLVELLVVIAIIAMLLAILMPALNKVRQIAYRMVCGSNLSGMGKACLTYANDYEECYPVTTGTPALQWSSTNSAEFWDVDVSAAPFDFASQVSSATVSSSLFLLVKFADVSTAQFVCKATDAKKFELSTTSGLQNNPSTTTIKDVAQCWDFGRTLGGTNGSWNYVSYSYQLPYAPTGSDMVKVSLSASTQAGVAIMADASPWWKNGARNTDIQTSYTAGMTDPYMASASDWGLPSGSASKEKVRLANSLNHQQEGQNVLYGDSHVSFEATSNVGIQQDNIYTPWASNTANTNADQSQIQCGMDPSSFPSGPNSSIGSYNEADSFLVGN